MSIEIKYSKKWRSEYKKGLYELLQEKKIYKGFVVFNGSQPEVHVSILALPFDLFCKKLHAGKII